MPLGLRVNTAILAPLRNLAQAVDDSASAYQRLSSGLRITKASDDAAGLAISNAIQYDKRVYAQGVRNVNDGISYLNIAEGAVNELGNIVSRLKELSAQASNETLGFSQRDALNEEATSLSQEYNRIIRYASFNDKDVLSTTNATLNIAAGYSAAKIDLNLAQGRATIPANVQFGGTGLAAGDNVLPTAISYDGRYVAFYSTSATLVAGDVNGNMDIFIQDRVTGVVELVSVSTAGVQGNGASNSSTISDDGRYVAFYGNVANNNLVIGDVNGVADIYLRDRTLDTTTLVSVSTAGVQANQPSDSEHISADGRYVVFRTAASNLVAGDTNGVSDVFLRDTVAGTTELISKSSSGVIGDAVSYASKISADGRFVVYTSNATNLVSGDTNAMTDIFKYEISTGTTTRVSLGADGQQAGSFYNSVAPSISADGRYVSFSSGSGFDKEQTFGLSHIFRKDTETGELDRVSRGYNTPAANAASSDSYISADGQFVTYWSDATNLVSGDTNLVRDVFVTDVENRVTARASESDSDVQGDGHSSAGDVPLISGNGDYVVFETAANNLITGGTLGGANAPIITTNPLFEENLVNLMTGISLTTADKASRSLTRLDSYENEISNIGSVVGAASSRLTYASSNLTSAVATLEDAYSKITDADIASDATKLLQANIRTQSALAVIQSGSQFSRLALDLIQESFGA